MRFVTVVIGLGSLLLTGCASIVSGHNQSLSVVAKNGNDDVIGARCSLTNDKGQWFATTPASVTVRRSYSAMAVDCTTERSAGASSVKSNTKAMAFGNVLFGGVIGVGVDVATGAAYDYPDVITVLLSSVVGPEPISSPSAVVPVVLLPPVQAVPSPSGAPATSSSHPAQAVSPIHVAASPPTEPAAASAPPIQAVRSSAAAEGPPAVPVAMVAKPSILGGKDSYSARKVAQTTQCHDLPAPILVAKSPGVELYSVTCKNGDLLAVQCDFGACNALKK
jgi:hypothetical protein